MSAISISINLDSLTNNLQVIKKRLAPNIKVMAVVKSNAYGHGAIEISRHLIKEGVNYLAVTNAQEALELRQAGITAPILIIALIDETEYLQCLQNDIMLTICSYQQLDVLEKIAEKNNCKAQVVLKIDTGMNRIGVKHTEALEYAKFILAKKQFLNFKGVTTHLACADEGLNAFTQQQLEKFKQAVEAILKLTYDLEIISCANSAGIFISDSIYGNTVRAGIALYGLKPDENIPVDMSDLKPILSFASKVLFIKTINSLDKVGYSGTFCSDKYTHIATIPVGYADGYPRNLSNKALVLIKDKFYPVVGNVCMSTLMVDLGDNSENIIVGETVKLFLAENDTPLSVDFLAKQANLINYELLCGLKPTIKRLYVQK